VPDENPSIVRTPLVIAMWEPMAEALGYPRKPLGFEDIVKLARSKAGRADYGLPEYGAFKLVHANPDYSTSGLSAVVAEYYAATGKKEGLRPEDVTGKARDTVRALERSIVHPTRDVEAVVRELEGQGDSATQVRVFTIAYSAGARGAREALAMIAEASGGNSYPGDPENIEAVYRSISSFF
jgi:Ca-activated chloride channel homolog